MGFEYNLTVTCDKCGTGFKYKTKPCKKELPSIDDVRRMNKDNGWKFIKNITIYYPTKYKVFCPKCAKIITTKTKGQVIKND